MSPVLLVPQALLVLLVRREREDQMESLVYPGLLAAVEREEPLEPVAFLVWRDELAQWDCLVIVVPPAPLAPAEPLVMPAALVKPVLWAQEVSLVTLDSLAPQEKRVLQAQLVKMGALALLDLLAQEASPVALDSQVPRALLVSPESLVRREVLAQLV